MGGNGVREEAVGEQRRMEAEDSPERNAAYSQRQVLRGGPPVMADNGEESAMMRAYDGWDGLDGSAAECIAMRDLLQQCVGDGAARGESPSLAAEAPRDLLQQCRVWKSAPDPE